MGRFRDLYFKGPTPNKSHIIEIYDKELAKVDENATLIMEIGFSDASVKWWKACFPNARFIGWDKALVEVTPPTLLDVRIRRSQIDSDAIKQAIEIGPYDLICDDAGHISAEQIETFKAMWDSIKPGGIYIIEDVQMWDAGEKVWEEVSRFATDGKGEFFESTVKTSKLIIIRKIT